MKINTIQILNNSKVIISAHIFASGPALELEEFLKNKVKTLLFIGHHFSYSKNKTSFYRLYKKGKTVKKTMFKRTFVPDVVMLFVELILTFLWVIKTREKFDYFIGSDNYSSFLGLVLKRLGFVKKVILYTIDFVPVRFKNSLMNNLYLYFDKTCLKNCDIVWNVSDAIALARDKYLKIKGKAAKQIVVPLGVWKKRIENISFEKRKKRIVFLGHILEKQGVQEVIKALPEILKYNPEYKFMIIGDGEYLNKLKLLTKENKLQNSVEFTGFITDHGKIEEMLSRSMLAVAPYVPDKNNFTYFADPGKIKNYLACGLPVVLTDVPKIAQILDKKKCGLITEYSANSIAKKINILLSNNNMLQSYSKNALEYSKEFDWDNIFIKALDITFNASS